MSENDLIQYRIDDEQHTTVACQRHRGDILSALRELGIGCIGTRAPSLSTCDGCETERLRAVTDGVEPDEPPC